MLAFDAVGHSYAWKGARVPGVTEIIAAALGNPFADVPARVLEHKRQIGEAAHMACHLDDAGDLDEGSVHSEVLPRLAAWRTFRREYRFDILLSEQRLYSERYGFAGTADRVAQLENGTVLIIDIKTGLTGPRAGLQTAAYAELAVEHLRRLTTPRRFALRALPTGRYKFDEYSHPGEWRDFLACLAIHRLKERLENE